MATERLQIYKCEVCGILAAVIEGGAGELVCCGQPMTLMVEKTEDKGSEKHVPVVEEKAGGVLVKVGEVPHPMEEKHYIMGIQVFSGQKMFCEFLKPGQAPQATFPVAKKDICCVREICNIHGLWKAKL